MSTPETTQTLPMLDVEQPRTYRKFRLVVQEVLPPPPSYANQGYHAPVNVVAATVSDFIRFAELLSPTDKALLKAVL